MTEQRTPTDRSEAPAIAAAAAGTEAAPLSALLAEHGGNVSAVARAMGKARMQVQRWIRRYGLSTRS